MSYNQDLKKVMSLYPDAETLSNEDFKDLINIHNIAEFAFGNNLDRELVLSAFQARNSFNLKNANDYYFLIFKVASKNHSLKKVAYPMMLGQLEIAPEFDLEKWSNLVYQIYDAVENKDMDLFSAIDYYASTLDQKNSEDKKFKRWIKYFQDGEHLKYNNKELSSLHKKGYQFSLVSPGNYGAENGILAPELNGSDFTMQKNKAVEKGSYLSWRNKLYSAIRRIDKLLRQSDSYISSSSQRELADLLHHFDQEVRSLQHKVTASDLAFKYANKFKKVGFDPGYQELVKLSQEVEGQSTSDTDGSDSLSETSSNNSEELSDDNDNEIELTSLEKAFTSQPGASVGEYEELAGDIELSDAVSKLEEVAGRLSDRRTIRLLAEFDIMLDKIGIAAMFPELAEAQSKLIDGYSYALTRVTKMLGMLSSGRSLIEISEAKKNDLASKTMKEVNKTLESEEPEQLSQTEKGAPAIQQELDAEKAKQQEQGNVQATPDTPPVA